MFGGLYGMPMLVFFAHLCSLLLLLEAPSCHRSDWESYPYTNHFNVVNTKITQLKNHHKWVVPSPNGSCLNCLWHWAYHINHHLSVTWWWHPYNFPSSQPSDFDFNIFSTDAIVAAQAQAMLRETETEPAWAVGKKGDTMSVHICV